MYDFLDLQEHSSGVVAAYIVGILAAAIIIFLVVRYLILLRVWVTEKKLHKNGKFSDLDHAGLANESLPLHHIDVK